MIVNCSWLAAILALSYCLYWLLITYMVFLQPTRMLFAYAFDGLLPRASHTHRREGTCVRGRAGVGDRVR